QWRAIEGCGTVAVPYIQCSDGGVGVQDAPAYLKLYGTKVTGYADGLPENLVIPDGVTEIGRGAFQDCTILESVEIPGSVKSIEDGSYRYGAFYGCTNLTSVTIGDGMTSIGDYAFDGCTSLTSVTIPTSVTEIGEYAFSLKEIQFPGTKEQWQAIEGSGGVNATCIFCTDGHIGIENVPDYLTMSGTVVTGYTDGLPENLVIPDGVTGIESRAFQNCTILVSVELPDSVERIGKYSGWGSDGAFNGCTNLTSVTIGDGVTEIGAAAFYECTSLTDVTIPGNVTKIGSYAFYGCESLTSMEIPDGVTKIEDSMFRNCTNLASVKIPDNVTSIGDEAFRKCTSLTSVKIPDNVTEIGDEAFEDCTNLAEVTIGNRVTTIGEYAFRDCESLASVVLPDDVTSIGSGSFSSCESLASVKIPDSVTTIGDYAFSYCTSLAEVTIPDSVTTIENNVFYECTSLASVTIPASVTSIGWYAFYGCTSLTEVTIPAKVTAIGLSAFQNCTRLADVTYNGTLAQWCAMDNDDDLMRYAKRVTLTGEDNMDLKQAETLVIPNGVTYIGEYAFYNCASLVSVEIPASVTEIGGNAFSLKEVQFKGTKAQWQAIEGSDAVKVSSVHCTDGYLGVEKVPDYLTMSGTGVTGHTDGLPANLVIPDGVTYIGYEAFSGCTNLTSVTIPASVESIQVRQIWGTYSAFDRCTNLKTVTYLGTLAQWCALNGGGYLISVVDASQVTMSDGTDLKTMTNLVIPNGVERIGVLRVLQAREPHERDDSRKRDGHRARCVLQLHEPCGSDLPRHGGAVERNRGNRQKRSVRQDNNICPITKEQPSRAKRRSALRYLPSFGASLWLDSKLARAREETKHRRARREALPKENTLCHGHPNLQG
ncbi:MAG: leucine-rich repeat domain-containing protein, partial [Treponemataceae bacterium]|nr:leucine-rich repeat domain-containing protein [Treponemataceae bacterium]